MQPRFGTTLADYDCNLLQWLNASPKPPKSWMTFSTLQTFPLLCWVSCVDYHFLDYNNYFFKKILGI